jgi:hypothetical protein
MLTVKIRMTTEDGAAFMASIDSLAERAARRERAQEKRARARRGEPEPERDELHDIRNARERGTARRITALATLAGAAADADRRAGDPPRREVVVHVDAAVLADDAAAGRAHLEGGPPLTPAAARRMLCEATVVAMLQNGREPLAVGRRKRRVTKAQRRTLLHRDGGCARPGCEESRVERLHGHHMRHWLFGGRTDLSNLVLLCDRDHGLVHDLDLVMARRDGALVVTAPDGRRVWGAGDAAFADGLAGLETIATARESFVGVHPVDTTVGRRPTPTPRRSTRAPVGRRDRVARPGTARTTRRVPPPSIGATLFPAGEPPLPQRMAVNGGRMDVRYVVGVLMTNRDLIRRLEAERGDVPAGTS